MLIGLILLLLAAYAFFGAVEVALAATAPARLRRLQQEHPYLRRALEEWLERPHQFLATIAVAVNATAILEGVVSAGLALHLADAWGFPRPLALTLSTAGVIFLLIVAGEALPKTFAIRSPERFVRWLLLPFYAVDRVLFPLTRLVVWIISHVTAGFGDAPGRRAPVVTLEEIRSLALAGEKAGVLEASISRMIHSALEFGGRKVGEVMTPRERVEATPADLPVEKFVDRVVETGHTRVPVYGRDLDDIRGIVNVKDTLAVLRNPQVFTVEDLMRPALFVSPETKVGDLLRTFQAGHQHLAVVRDGSRVAGVVTLEDLLEEIVGEILDESDREVLLRRVSG